MRYSLFPAIAAFGICTALPDYPYYHPPSQYNVTDIIASQTLDNLVPNWFPLFSDNGTSTMFPMPLCNGFELEEATIDQMQAAMKRGQLTAVQLLQCYTERMYQTNSYTSAVLQVNPDAMAIASSLDALRRSGHVLGPLHGIPFTVKDNIASKDRLETTAGSWMLLGNVVPRDSHVVMRLRQAGAVLMGKAGLSEWADMRSNNYSEGYSPRGGQVRSPYNLTTNPGGSSSGSAAGVAANTFAFALGTETDGSVINPAERNAVVGIKPSVGLTSRAGVVPESIHQDSVGCFGKTVRDASYVLDAIYGVDPNDNYTSAQVGKTPVGGYTQFLTDKSALKGATFGIPWLSFWTLGEPSQIAQLTALVQLIEAAGATIINGTEIPDRDTIISPDGWNWDYGTTRGYVNESEYTVVKVDFYNDIKRYLSEANNTNIRTLEDIVAYGIENLGTEAGLPDIHPAFGSGQDGFLASLEWGGVMNETYFQALNFTQSTTRYGIDSALINPRTGKKLDGLLVPPDVGQTYQLAAQAQYPMITIPAGVTSYSGMPYGLGIMNTMWSEAELVKWASAIEDLQMSQAADYPYKRTSPKWLDYLERNLPVPFTDYVKTGCPYPTC